MGFGILFIGYFLLLNITYYSFTDVIAGLVLTLAFNKLSNVNKYFRLAEIPTGLFALLGLGQLAVSVYTMFFKPLELTAYNSVIGAVRFVVIAVFSMLMLLGIENVANEVELEKLPRKARVSIPFSLTVFSLCAIFEIPQLSTLFDAYTVAVFGFALLCGFMIIVVLNLTVIYSAYMRICMPSQLAKQNKTSKFRFVEAFKKHEEQRRQEYLEYKISKRKGKKK